MEIWKTLYSQGNLEKEEWKWRNQCAWLQAILQSYSHQDSMVLAQRQKYRWMELDRKSREKSTHLIFDKGGRNIQWRKDSLFNKWCWENWSTTCKRMKLEHSNTIHKNIFTFWILKGTQPQLLRNCFYLKTKLIPTSKPPTLKELLEPAVSNQLLRVVRCEIRERKNDQKKPGQRMWSNILGTSPVSREPFQDLKQRNQNMKFKHEKVNLKAYKGLTLRGRKQRWGKQLKANWLVKTSSTEC